MKQALYRKYRPNTFSEVCGQDHVTTILKSQVESSSPSHAYLFTGSRGTGKTSSAKILAKAINCESPNGGDPCCECAACKSIAAGTALDIVEIDAASNNSVADIRELCDNVSYPPCACKYKVYIIDEVHMLTKDAFNALLKTLEEPPSHVVFILATTEVHEVPATVLSRCQRFDFNRAPSDVIADRLEFVCEKEGFEIDRDASLLIAKLSDGGFRDALSLLDLCSAPGGKITVDSVTAAAGLTGRDSLFKIGSAIAEGNVAAVLREVSGLYERSCDMMRLCADLGEYYRNIMVAKAVEDPSELINESPDEIERIKQAANNIRFDRAAAASDLLGECVRLMKQGKNKRIALETTLIKMCMQSDSGELSELRSRVEKLEEAVKSGISVPAKPESVPKRTAAHKNQDRTPAEKIDYDRAAPLESWPEVVEKLKEKSMMLATVLSNSSAYILNDLLLIDVDNPDFAQMVNNDARHRDNIKEAAYAVTGQTLRLAPYRRRTACSTGGKADKIDALMRDNADVVSDMNQ